MPSRYSSDAPPPVEMCAERVLVEPERAHGRGRVTAADDGKPSALRRSPRPRPGCRPRTAPARTRPSGRSRTRSRASASTRGERGDAVAGPMSRPFCRRGIASAATTWVRGVVRLQLARRPRCQSAAPDLVAGARRAAAGRSSIWSSSSSESPTSWPCAARNVKHMPPPTSSRSTLGSSASITASLSRHLRAAEHDDVRPLRLAGQLAQHRDLGRHQARRRSAAAAAATS